MANSGTEPSSDERADAADVETACPSPGALEVLARDANGLFELCGAELCPDAGLLSVSARGVEPPGVGDKVERE